MVGRCSQPSPLNFYEQDEKDVLTLVGRDAPVRAPIRTWGTRHIDIDVIACHGSFSNELDPSATNNHFRASMAESYVSLVENDVCWHHASSREEEEEEEWPPAVSRFVRSLRKEMKLPGWLKSGLVPYENERVLALLRHIRVANADVPDLWENTECSVDDDDVVVNERLHVTFDTALADCARIRSVIDTERLTDTCCPKESFIAVLLRNALWNADPKLCHLEDSPVVLPRHFSGEAVPILKFMSKSVRAPLIVSVREEMPVEEEACDDESSESEESSKKSTEVTPPRPTLSEWLDACERPKTPEEVEEEKGDEVLSPRFDAHFVACPPSANLPSVCHMPILCMAEEEELPVLMSSLLYHRRVWHITEPLLGIEFSRYDTTLRLLFGWLEDEVSSDRVLPRVHLGEIEPPFIIDLSFPSIALVISRLLCSLEPHISRVRATMKQSAGTVMAETESHSTLSWRIDTHVEEDTTSVAGSDDMITRWAKNQSCVHDFEKTSFDEQVDNVAS